ncbi:amidophosphoribosyltransferase [Cupriavidus sp. CP313]
MCGIVGIVGARPVNQLLYDTLLRLQHRGQDAAGIATAQGSRFHLHKAKGLVRDVFRTRDMRSLSGHSGIGHTRYPTAGSAISDEEAQPFYVNSPFGITLSHNGNLTNTTQLRAEVQSINHRHVNTQSDSEVLLNVLASELQDATCGIGIDSDAVFRAVSGVHRRVRGAYAVVASIANLGLLAFRDPNGIRPLCIGYREFGPAREWMIASESAALEGSGFTLMRDVAPGEGILIDHTGKLAYKQCAPSARSLPCVFEFVYFARPDSVIDGVSVYAARLRMGEYLARSVASNFRSADIDVVMPVPDSSRPAAMQLAASLNLPYREGLVKNRYIGRTFIMPGQQVRQRSVRQKLNAMGVEFKGKNVLIVDDSIVRGTTSREIVNMARTAGANRVYLASAAAPIRYPNVYGIDMPLQEELIASGHDVDQISAILGVDGLVYQDYMDMQKSVTDLNPTLTGLETSCFDGRYVTGDVTPQYLEKLGELRRC